VKHTAWPLEIYNIGCVVCLVDPLFKADEVPYYVEDSVPNV